jgi:hypothetical protein
MPRAVTGDPTERCRYRGAPPEPLESFAKAPASKKHPRAFLVRLRQTNDAEVRALKLDRDLIIPSSSADTRMTSLPILEGRIPMAAVRLPSVTGWAKALIRDSEMLLNSLHPLEQVREQLALRWGSLLGGDRFKIASKVLRRDAP